MRAAGRLTLVFCLQITIKDITVAIIYYFAYGSNMLEERLKSSDRVPNAVFKVVGSIQGYKMQFNKRSLDHSGKCNIVKTNSIYDVVFGIVYEILSEELKELDNAEDLGHGYHHEKDFLVHSTNGTLISALTYVADQDVIDNGLMPYSWYHKLVVAGAEQHLLPKSYIETLCYIQILEDPDINRAAKKDAEVALNKYYSSICS